MFWSRIAVFLLLGISLVVPVGGTTVHAQNPPDPNLQTSDSISDIFRCGAGRVRGDSDEGDAGRCGLADYIAEPSGFVYQSWRSVRIVINVLLVIALLVIAFSNITRVNIDSYTLKKSLPNLILGVILANASFLIVRWLADIATVISYLFVELSLGENFSFADFVSAAIAQLTESSILTVGGGISIVLLIPAVIAAIILLLWLAFLLYFRLVAVYLLTILAPLAFVAYGIPGQEKYFKLWWQHMIKWMFMVPAMSAVFWLMIVIGRSGDSQSIARLLIMYVLFFIACTIPTRFGGSIMDKASGFFKKYSGVDYAGRKLAEAGQDARERAGFRWQQAWRRAPIGKQLATYAEKRALDKENMKTDIEQLRQAAATRARRGRTGTNEAALEARGAQIGDELAAVKAGKLAEYIKSPEGQKQLTEAIRSELTKRSAESERDNLRIEGKIEFMNKEKDGELIKGLYQNVFNAKRSGDQLELDDSIAIGKVAHERIQPLQALENFHKHQEEYNRLSEADRKGAIGKRLEQAMGEEKRAFEALKKKPEHQAEFGKLAFEDALSEFKDGKSQRALLWRATHGRGRRIFNEGIQKQNEILIKEGTAAEVKGEIDGIYNKFKDAFGEAEAKVKMKLLFEGNTAKLQQDLEKAAAEAKEKGEKFKGPDIRDVLLATNAQKQIIAKPSDYRNKEVLQHFIELHNSIVEPEHVIDYNPKELEKREYRSNLGQRVNSRVGAVFGSPSDQVHKGGHVVVGDQPAVQTTSPVDQYIQSQSPQENQGTGDEEESYADEDEDETAEE